MPGPSAWPGFRRDSPTGSWCSRSKRSSSTRRPITTPPSMSACCFGTTPPSASAGRSRANRRLPSGTAGACPSSRPKPRLESFLIGKNGQLGHELARSLPAVMEEVVATDRAQLELTDLDAVRRKVRDVRPNLIINASAYNAVDRAEDESRLAMAVNAVAPGVLAEEAKRLDALLAHNSTI